MRLSCSYQILLYRPPGLKASVMICNALDDILINPLYALREAGSTRQEQAGNCRKYSFHWKRAFLTTNDLAHRWRPIRNFRIATWRCGAALRCRVGAGLAPDAPHGPVREQFAHTVR